MTQQQVTRIRELYELFAQERDAQKLAALSAELSKLLELEVQEMRWTRPDSLERLADASAILAARKA